MVGTKDTIVPKFSSFRPRNPSVTQEVSGKYDANDVERINRINHDKRQSGGGRERDRNKSNNSRPHTSSLPGRSKEKQHIIDNHRDTFIIDTKGDQKNLIFGSLHAYSVPRYRRYRADQVLGAQSDLKVDRSLEDEKVIVLVSAKSRKHQSQTKGKYIFSKIIRQRPRLLKPHLFLENSDSIESDFISLRPQKRRKITSEDKSGLERDEDHTSISNEFLKNDLTLQHDSDSDLATDSSYESNRYMEIDSAVRKKNVILCRKVDQFPQDIDAWIELINHQDLMNPRPDDSQKTTQAMLRSTTEIKIHMYEKALKHTKSLQNRERLLVGLMSEGAKIWELKIQAKRWEQISKDNIDSLVLWTKFLDFKQSTFSTFRYEEVKDVYLQRFKLLSETIDNESKNNIEKAYHELIYIILRASLFIRESGFCELAVALWQSILEINFCGPDGDRRRSVLINDFRDFWESEVPRIGEAGALGWRQNINAQGISDVPEPTIDKIDDYLDKTNIFQSWATAERIRSMTSRIPAKTLDEVVEDDPYRVILFSDIEELLLFLPPESKSLHKSCINAFLIFCRLPELTDVGDEQHERWRDLFMAEDPLESDLSWIENYLCLKKENVDHGISQFSLTLFPNFAHTSESIFRGVIANQGMLNALKDRFSGDNGPISYSYIRNCLKLLIQNWPDDALTEYYLSFEHANEPDTIKKISKRLLKQNTFSFRLYHAYALIEWCKGNKEAAENVFTVALNMGKSFSKTEQNDLSIMLWKSWIWAYLEEKNGLAALKLLVCIPDGVPNPSIEISPTLIVRARQYLITNRGFFITSDASLAVMFTECLAILEYLSNSPDQGLASGDQRNITSSMEIFLSVSTILLQRHQERSHEVLLQSASRLLYCHSQSGPYRPACIREHLTNFLRHFPKNTVFLSLYRWNESRLRIDNRVRNILLNTILTPENDTLTSRLFAIQHEIITGTPHSVKAAFEHSVTSPATQLSACLWRMYILYCLQTPNLRSQAQIIWHRALRACPWSKELYVTGFEKIGALANFSQSKSTWMVMEEKELRVHVDLHDVFAEIEDPK
ncbi:hypothetical protein K3495_g12758 [Podosphaera aphanis]|nr:hypothetical protein K3495_g12758 [Podosphaera aphanis]